MFTFKHKDLEAEFDSLLPELQNILEEFGHWSAGAKIPMPVVTCLARSEAENAAIYNGKPRFSWHIPNKDTGLIHAMDLRVTHYSAEQKAKVFMWFNERCPDPRKFELIVRPHGTGPHIHLAIRA